MDLWRLTKYPSLSGEGGRLYAARWNSVGAPVVYLADSPGSALSEILVHLQIEDDEVPTDFVWLRVNIPASMSIPSLYTPKNEAWKSDLVLTRELGDAWLKSQSSALTRVPSAILPDTNNYLLNPLHKDASAVKIAKSIPAHFDPRLFHRSKPK
jgi:RES domain-containing protein